MLPTHRKILEALAEGDGDFSYFGFKTLCSKTKMERKEVRRITRHLARRGLTEFGRGLWTDDGEPAGSGYRITDQGRDVLETSGMRE